MENIKGKVLPEGAKLLGTSSFYELPEAGFRTGLARTKYFEIYQIQNWPN